MLMRVTSPGNHVQQGSPDAAASASNTARAANSCVEMPPRVKMKPAIYKMMIVMDRLMKVCAMHVVFANHYLKSVAMTATTTAMVQPTKGNYAQTIASACAVNVRRHASGVNVSDRISRV